ncbi:MAG: hypothetical protein LBD17_00665, partial [Endomicrobium sp.]|nr:hypothetical protein [Endomicrobium sp.]
MSKCFSLFEAFTFKQYIFSFLTIILTPGIAFSQSHMISKYPFITPPPPFNSQLPTPQILSSPLYEKIDLSTHPNQSNKQYIFSFLTIILTSSITFNQSFNITIIHSFCLHITPSTALLIFLSLP